MALWTPEGMVSTTEKGVVPVTRNDIAVLARFHEFAQRHGLSVICKKCNSAIEGRNRSANEPVMSVSCQCREFLYRA